MAERVYVKSSRCDEGGLRQQNVALQRAQPRETEVKSPLQRERRRPSEFSGADGDANNDSDSGDGERRKMGESNATITRHLRLLDSVKSFHVLSSQLCPHGPGLSANHLYPHAARQGPKGKPHERRLDRYTCASSANILHLLTLRIFSAY
jgi:hypothetical protein